jgi:glycerol kinase
MAMLPEVRPSAGLFGQSTADIFGVPVPITGVAGDQQAALFGQACFAPGMAKSTFGTGAFMLVNTGGEAVTSRHRLLTTPAYRLDGKINYALEGSIFVAGAAVRWLRDGLGIIAEPADTDGMAAGVADSHGIYLVPAFVGLGAPHWDPDARGALFGLTLDTTRAHLARAALEAVAYQTFDLAEAMAGDGAAATSTLRIDGGMAANAWLCQFLADILQVPVERPRNLETTALGAAYLAGLATGVWGSTEELAASWQRRDVFIPKMDAEQRSRLIAGWRDAVARTLSR